MVVMMENINVTGWYYQDPLGLWFITHPVEIMTIVFLTFIILFILNIKTLKRGIRGIDRKTLMVLFVIFLIGFWLRNTEYRYGTGYDGYFYLNCAKLMFNHDIQVWSCGIGNDNHCYLYNEHLSPAGYPYLIYLSYILFGVHDINAMVISAILGSLSILLVFLIAYLLFKDEKPALYSATIFAFIPFDIFLSSTAAVRTASLFFSGLAFLIYLIAIRKDSMKLWCLVAIAVSLSTYMRQENSLLLVPMTLVFLFERKSRLKTLHKNCVFRFLKKYWLPLLIFFASQIPVQHWVSYRNTYNIYNVQNFSIMTKTMLETLFFPLRFMNNIFFYNPVVSAFLLLSALLFLIKTHRDKILVLWSWFLAYFILYSVYFQCPGFPQNFCFEYLRYMQHLHIPIAILSGLVFYEAGKKIHLKHITWAILSLLFVITFSFLLYAPNISGVEFSLFKDGRMNEPFTSEMIEAVNKTPSDSIIFISQAIVPEFDYFRNESRIVIDINVYNSNSYSWARDALSDNKGRPIYFINDIACEDYLENSECDFIRKNFEFNKLENINRIKIFELK